MPSDCEVRSMPATTDHASDHDQTMTRPLGMTAGDCGAKLLVAGITGSVVAGRWCGAK